jgi:hypothetical protein
LRFVLDGMAAEVSLRAAPNTLRQLFGWGTKNLSFHRLSVFAVSDEDPSCIGWG